MRGFGADPKIAAAIQRLATDDRMRPEWDKLLKRGCNSAVLRHLFSVAALLTTSALPAMTRTEIDRDTARTGEIAASLRKPATIASLWLSEADRTATVSLAKTADELDRGAQLWRQLPFPIVERHRTPAEVQGCVIALAREVKRLFGKSLSEITTMTVARVAMGNNKITRQVVRDAFKASGF